MLVKRLLILKSKLAIITLYQASLHGSKNINFHARTVCYLFQFFSEPVLDLVKTKMTGFSTVQKRQLLQVSQ